MASYDKLTPTYKNYFKKLREIKPDVDFRGRKIGWEEMVRNVKILSEPVNAVNHEKLKFKRALSMSMVNDNKGKAKVPSTGY